MQARNKAVVARHFVTFGPFRNGFQQFLYLMQFSRHQFLLVGLGALSFIYQVVGFIVDAVAFGHRLHPLQMAGAAAILLAAVGMMRVRRLPAQPCLNND